MNRFPDEAFFYVSSFDLFGIYVLRYLLESEANNNFPHNFFSGLGIDDLNGFCNGGAFGLWRTS